MFSGWVFYSILFCSGWIFHIKQLHNTDDEKMLTELLESIEDSKVNKESKFGKLKKRQFRIQREMNRKNLTLKQQINKMQMDLDVRQTQIKDYESKCYQNERLIESQLKKISELELNSKSLENELEVKQTLFSELELEMERMKSNLKEKFDSERDRLKNISECLSTEKQSQLENKQCLSNENMHLIQEILNANNTNCELVKQLRQRV